MNAFSAAIGEALVPLAEDPLLVWNYGVPAILAAIGGTVFWIQFRGLDAAEDELNMLPEGHTFTPPKNVEGEGERPVAGTIAIDEEKNA
jgi:POT family proton-dependent oligopeptide transporter